MNDVDDLIAAYAPTNEAITTVRSVKTVLLVGISGAGKDTIKHRLLLGGEFRDIVSHTTRQPRANRGKMEVDGYEYHFVSLDQMKDMLQRRELIEANRYSNNIYATSSAEFGLAAAEGKIAITDIDINGVEAYKAIAPESVFPIFLIPPTYEVWFERWRQRYGDDYVNHLDDFERRQQTAIIELRHVLATPHFFFVINDDLERAISRVERIAHTGHQNEAELRAGRLAAEQLLDVMLDA